MAEDTIIERREKRKLKRIQYTHRQTFDKFIHDVLQSLDDRASIAKDAMRIVNTLVQDSFEDLAAASKHLMLRTESRTLDEWDVQHATSLVFEGEIARHAINEGMKAVNQYREVVSRSK